MDKIPHSRYVSPMEEKAVAIEDLILDIGCQPRADLNPEAVEEYAELYKAGTGLPPVDVVVVDGDLVVIDGFHRIAGRVKAGEPFVRVQVLEASDLGRARWLAAAANQGHGVRRTNRDKRTAVELALDSDVGQEQSLQVIADHIGVSKAFVGKVRLERESSTVDDEPASEPPPETPDEEPEDQDMYQTAGKAIKGCYRRVCKILGEEDDVCEQLFRALEAAQEREL